MAKRRAARPQANDQVEIVNAFRRILQALRLAAVQTQAQTGISAAQLFVLSKLHDRGALSIGELAEATLTDRSSVADVVDRLARRRLLRRTADPADRRRAIVSLTPSGRTLLQKAPPAPTAMLLDGLKGLSSTELKGLSRGLARMCEELGLDEQPAHMLFERSARRGRAGRRAQPD